MCGLSRIAFAFFRATTLVVLENRQAAEAVSDRYPNAALCSMHAFTVRRRSKKPTLWPSVCNR